ncbi:MAG: DUF192 domain-containing protein [Marinobacter sp.]|uniref:DUF192 domain-containing protein n=1 Tax=Marinobacter sp. TaxID=50741 RepID=UPI003F9E023A
MRNQCALLCFVGMLASCSSGSGAVEPSAGLPVIAGCFVTDASTINISLELAQAPHERRKGLMGREFLAATSGMLFQYQKQQRPSHGFWMYQTFIPLDIAYLDGNGVIGNIRQMAPCESSSGANCPSYPAGVEFITAVEMNTGFFEANGISVGDRLNLGKTNCQGS